MSRERDLLGEALRRAQRAGARRAEAFRSVAVGRSVEYSDRGLESYRGSDAAGIGLRVFVGRRAGFAYGQDASSAGLERLAGRAVAAAAVAELPAFPTPRGRALAEQLGILDVPGLAAPLAEDRERLEAIVAQARAADPAVRRIKTVSLRSGRRETFVRSSAGTRLEGLRHGYSRI